jgi:hypothetical protein
MQNIIQLKKISLLGFLFVLAIFNQCSDWEIRSIRKEIDLKGDWQMQLDDDFIGNQEEWFLMNLSDTVQLPGSLDENGKGHTRKDSTYNHLNRPVYYTGKVWYRKEIEIPEDWNGEVIRLVMERTKVTEVWFDSIYIGTSKLIYSPQYYNLTAVVTPGKHTLTIAVDNREDLVPVAGSHAYSENTQTNWNGIIGRFCLEARNKISFEKVKVTPDIKNNKARIMVQLDGREKAGSLLSVTVRGKLINSRQNHKVPVETYIWTSDKNISVMEFNYFMEDEVRLWSEFNPSLYKLEFVLNERGVPIDNYTVIFGMREFTTEGTNFIINGKTTFLRGKHDACVFPLTGYPPTSVKEWEKIFKTAKDWGINHYRYHSWTPPEAAFIAADKVGIYMQPELPIWWGFNAKDTNQVNYLINLGERILDEYANYASFTMFSLGNEINQERKVLKEMVDDLREHDPRPLFAQGSNNRLWDPSYAEGDDFFVSFRAAKDPGDNSMDIRTSMSYMDSKAGGILNNLYPSTDFNYSEALKNSPVPMIGFEVGQYQVYPDFNELPKYTGVLKPWNLELYKKDLEQAGMIDRAEDFFKASGQLSALCYKADIEAAIRTPGFGGFHLLDLQDYPGQGTALVGMLDAFMENKGILKPEEFRQFCDEIVVLAEFEKYCWDTTETFDARILVANYSKSVLYDETLEWELAYSANNNTFAKGKITNNDVEQGGVTEFGNIKVNLSDIEKPSQLVFKLHLGSGNSNRYPLWVYPPADVYVPENVVVGNLLYVEDYMKLIAGGSILLFPSMEDIRDNSVGCQFISDFWNFAMFEMLANQFNKGRSPGTMGLLMDPDHPLFNYFPTDFHSNWQWWPMTSHCSSLILDALGSSYKPVVQIIDNINRNHKLSMISEFKVGKGKLIVCTAPLPELGKYAEARQLYISMLNYVTSKDFKPEFELDRKQLMDLGLMKLKHP